MFKLAFICLQSFCLFAAAQSFNGKASYYALRFNGRKTANGEIFSNDSMTAAHKTLPFGTRVKVTNLRNNKVVFVRINDRLPQHSKRVIDLSQRAARDLDFFRKGLTTVKIETQN